jgi:hypothetical protein
MSGLQKNVESFNNSDLSDGGNNLLLTENKIANTAKNNMPNNSSTIPSVMLTERLQMPNINRVIPPRSNKIAATGLHEDGYLR